MEHFCKGKIRISSPPPCSSPWNAWFVLEVFSNVQHNEQAEASSIVGRRDHAFPTIFDNQLALTCLNLFELLLSYSSSAYVPPPHLPPHSQGHFSMMVM